MNTVRIVIALVLVTLAGDALACSSPPGPKNAAEAFANSDAVFLGRATNYHRFPMEGANAADPNNQLFTEEYEFEVLRSWMLNLKAGERVRMRSDVGPGPCGMSVYNDPKHYEFLGKQDPDTGEAEDVTPKFSGTWLVYASGSVQPYYLHMDSRSMPIEAGLEKEMAELDRVALRAGSSFSCANNGLRIQQLRIYEINRDHRAAFHQRFRDHALRIMKKYDFRVVDIWESDTGTKLQFVYVLDWPDRPTMDAAWKRFLADAEWIEIKKRTAALGLVNEVSNSQPLERLNYSPACAKGK